MLRTLTLFTLLSFTMGLVTFEVTTAVAQSKRGKNMRAAPRPDAGKRRSRKSAAKTVASSAKGGLGGVEPARIGIGHFRGHRNHVVRAAVIEAVESDPAYDVGWTLPRKKKKRSVNLVTAQDYVELGQKENLQAFLEGKVQRRKKKWEAEIEVRDAATGTVLGSHTWAAPNRGKLRRKVDKELTSSLGPYLEAAKAKGEPPPPLPSSPPSVQAKKEEVEEKVSPRPVYANDETVFDLSAGISLLSRDFNNPDEVLRPVTLSFTPAMTVTVDLYPAALVAEGFWARLALAAGATEAFSITSRDPNNRAFDTTYRSGFVGLKYRQPVGPVDLALSGVYGRESFEVQDEGDVQAGVPQVRYQYPLVRAQGRLQLTSNVALLGSLGYLVVTQAGELDNANYFPRLSAQAWELGGGGSIRVVGGLELRAAINYRRYDLSFNPSVDSALSTDSASDRFTTVQFGLAYLLRQKPAPSMF